MKRNALARAVKIFDFGTPLVDNRVERICNFVFVFKFRLKFRLFKEKILTKRRQNDDSSDEKERL